jgi:predicted ribosome quality control (RQC) complex YloA/Tae2 family protein
MTDDAERETLRQSGELILAYQFAIQKGQSELRAQYETDAPELVIALDPTTTPLENAQRYFEKYNKAKRALDDVPRLIKETESELAFLAQLDTDLELASNWPEIDEVQQTLQAKGYWRGKPAQRIAGGGKSAPLRVVTSDGFVIWVGRNSRQNEIVTFDKGSPNDLWLHARDVPGAHVIVKTDGRPVPESVIERAAALAAYYSAKQSEGKVIVDMTYRRYVKKIKGAGPGMVTYRNEETRTVAPRSERDMDAKGSL